MQPKSSIRFRWDILLLLFSVRDSIPSNNIRYAKKEKEEKLLFKTEFYRYSWEYRKRKSQSNIYCNAFPKMIYKGAFIIVVSFLFEIYYICKKNIPVQFHGFTWFILCSFACSCMFEGKKKVLSLTKSVVNWWYMYKTSKQ